MGLSSDDHRRLAAAKRAVQLIDEDMILGIGSGRAVAKFIEQLAARIKKEHIQVKAVPTSTQTFLLCIRYGIPLTSLDAHSRIDLDIDGADQVEEGSFTMIKGGGGALLREKIVASSSQRRVILIEESKIVKQLDHSLPLEVLPFALGFCLRELSCFGVPVLREGSGKLGPVITDNGNYIVDVDLGIIKDARKIELELKCIPGILETGLFINLANEVILGSDTGDTKMILKESV